LSINNLNRRSYYIENNKCSNRALIKKLTFKNIYHGQQSNQRRKVAIRKGKRTPNKNANINHQDATHVNIM